MHIKIENNLKLLNFFGFFGLFLMIINSSTIYDYYFPSISDFCLIIGGVCSVLLVLLSYKKIFFKSTLMYVFVWIFCIILTSVINGFDVSSLYYILKFTVIFLIISILKINHIDYLNIIFKICKIFGLWAILNYIFLTVFGWTNFPITNSFLTHWGGQYNLYLGFLMNNTSGYLTLAGLTIIRLHVPFSEPGVAQLFFNLGLFFSLFIYKSKSKRWSLLFIALLILTTSLTGYAIMSLLFLFYFLSKKNYLPIFIFAILATCFLGITIDEKINSLSYVDRMSDYKYVFTNGFKNLPFGIGLGRSEFLVSRIDQNTGAVYNHSLFSGLFTPFLYLGIFSLYFYYLLYLSTKYVSYEKNIFKSMAFATIILITLLTEPLAFTTILAIFYMNGIINKVCIKNKICFEGEKNAGTY